MNSVCPFLIFPLTMIVQHTFILVGSLITPSFSLASKRHSNVICQPGMKYCGYEIGIDSSDTDNIYICNRKGDQWIPQACPDGKSCVVGDVKDPLCLEPCVPGSYYCGNILTKMGYGQIEALKETSLYYCESSIEIFLNQTCLGACVPRSPHSYCKQACEPGLMYCGHELNSFEGQSKTYTPKYLYYCNASKVGQLKTKCPKICQTSTADSFCSPKMYYDACKPRQSILRVKRVQDGSAAKPGKWPWMASLRNNDDHFCGGILISSKWILTAAHCLFKRQKIVGLKIQVVLGNISPDSYAKGELRQTTDQYIIHENYDDNDPTYKNDIALLRLKTPVTFRDHMQPLCLSTISLKGKDCVVAGWGQLETGSFPSVLQEGVVSILTRDECRTRYKTILQDSSDEDKVNESLVICAGQNFRNVDTCSGDSGGPLMCQNDDGTWHAVGLTSWGSHHACTQTAKVLLSYGFYTRISTFIPWIEEKSGLKVSKISNDSGWNKIARPRP